MSLQHNSSNAKNASIPGGIMIDTKKNLKIIVKPNSSKTEITKQEEDGSKSFLGYADLAKFCTDNPPKDGWDKDSMKLSIKIEDKLEKAKLGDKIKLEDAEFEYLYKAAQPNSMKWAMKHKDLIAFLDYIETLKKE